MATREKKVVKQPAKRQRKSHRKSRLGCQNCKLRSIKCDEDKPSCKRCTDSGFTCSYNSATPPASGLSQEPALELDHVGAFKVQLDKPGRATSSPLTDLPAQNPPVHVPSHMPWSDGDDCYELTPDDILTLDAFQHTLVETLGSGTMKGHCAMGVRTLAIQHPYLLHSYLAMTHIYQQDLCMAKGLPQSTRSQAALAYHWYQASVRHNQTLRVTGHTSSQKDAIWAAATLLNTAAFGYLESHDPSKHWPNKPTETGDLNWLRLSIGKKAIWELTNPLRDDSMFRCIIADIGIWNPPQPDRPIPPNTFPSAFTSLLGLDETSTVENNPFFSPASILAQLLPERCDSTYLIRFLDFAKNLSDTFCHLLASKEPRALLLLCWWWAKTCPHEGWWLSRRATVEGRAICLYLEKNYGSDQRIMELLRFPRAVLDLVVHSPQLAMARSTYITEPPV